MHMHTHTHCNNMHMHIQEWMDDPTLPAQLVKPSWLQQAEDSGLPGTENHKWRSSVKRFIDPAQVVNPLCDAALAGVMPPSPQPRSPLAEPFADGHRSIGGRSSAGSDCMPALTMARGDTPKSTRTSAPTRRIGKSNATEPEFVSSLVVQSSPASGEPGKLVSS